MVALLAEVIALVAQGLWLASRTARRRLPLSEMMWSIFNWGTAGGWRPTIPSTA